MLRFKLILYNAEGEIVYQNNLTTKQGRIEYHARNHEWYSAHLKVFYEDYDTINEGIYYTVDDLLYALKAFTEKWLLDALAGKEIE